VAVALVICQSAGLLVSQWLFMPPTRLYPGIFSLTVFLSYSTDATVTSDTIVTTGT
jgi:hypothetical protein